MTDVFTVRQRNVLKRIFGDNARIELVEKAESSGLSRNEAGELCGLVSDEMLMNGIEANFEPTPYGKELEAIIDVINRNFPR